MWYIVYRDDDGAMVSIGTSIATPLPPGLSAVPYETQPDLAATMWDPVQRMLVPRPPAALTTISKRAFMGRIPVEHLIALNALRLDPATPLQLRATLDTAAELRDMVTEINLLDPATQAFVPVATDALIMVGKVAEEDRAAYIAAWLALPSATG